MKRCIVNNANPATLLWKIKRRCELNKRDGACTGPIVLAEEELDCGKSNLRKIKNYCHWTQRYDPGGDMSGSIKWKVCIVLQ